jgi:hypothetical protein
MSFKNLNYAYLGTSIAANLVVIFETLLRLLQGK